MTDTVEITEQKGLRDATFGEIIRVAHGAGVTVPSRTYALLDEHRGQVVQYIRETNQPAYGFNRGFGSNVRTPVAPEDVTALQENLIRSHACCLGEPAPIEVVRATMFLRAKSLARGFSAVRSVVVRQFVEALNRGVIPVVPSFGSVSASGDLAPLSHIALGLFLGEGEAYLAPPGPGAPVRMPAAEALAQAGMHKINLEMKEGLALNNGVQYSTAICALSADKLLTILKTASIATALSAQVMLGADTPFRDDLHELREHEGSVTIAKCIFELMKASPLREAHLQYDIDGEIQDPYNLRCAAQILGPCLELIWRAIRTVTIEANSVTDNPVILKADRNSIIKDPAKYMGKFVDIISGGHFHGMPIAVDAFGLIQAASIISSLSNTRCARFVDGDRNKGLGADLKWPGKILPKKLWPESATYESDKRRQSIQSSMMIPEYASASLTNWIWGQSTPNHLFSLSTDAGQEDHVSMAANVALKAYQIMPRLAEVIAIELAFASQAAAIRKEAPAIPSRIPESDARDEDERYRWQPIEPAKRSLSSVSERVLEVVQSHFPIVKEDQVMATGLAKLAAAVLSGDIVNAAEGESDYFSDFRHSR